MSAFPYKILWWVLSPVFCDCPHGSIIDLLLCGASLWPRDPRPCSQPSYWLCHGPEGLRHLLSLRGRRHGAVPKPGHRREDHRDGHQGRGDVPVEVWRSGEPGTTWEWVVWEDWLEGHVGLGDGQGEPRQTSVWGVQTQPQLQWLGPGPHGQCRGSAGGETQPSVSWLGGGTGGKTEEDLLW